MEERESDLNRLKGILKCLPGSFFNPIIRQRRANAGFCIKEEMFEQPGVELATSINLMNSKGYRGKMLVGRPDGSISHIEIKGVYLPDGAVEERNRESECKPEEWDIVAICDSFTTSA